MRLRWLTFAACAECLMFSLSSALTVEDNKDDSAFGESSSFSFFTAISDMADKAAHSFSDAFLPGIQSPGARGGAGSRRIFTKFPQQTANHIQGSKRFKRPKKFKKFPDRLKVPGFKRSLKKFLGQNMKIVSGPELGVDITTSTAASRSFSVTPTVGGVFEVEPITVSPAPAKIKIIQPIQFVSSTQRNNQQFLTTSVSTDSPWSSVTTPRNIFSSPASTSRRSRPSPTQRRRVPKQQPPALSFQEPQLARQETNDVLGDLPDLTPLGVRLSLEDMVRNAGQDVEMRPIPGEPGVDYPVFSSVPDTDFNCVQQEYPGIYTDVQSNCQVFHFCMPDSGVVNSFLCPNGTMFSQQYFVCDWWYNVDCGAQEQFANLNQLLYQESGQERNCKTLFCIDD